jgi:predicted site-specific integrase-resolvase
LIQSPQLNHWKIACIEISIKTFSWIKSKRIRIIRKNSWKIELTENKCEKYLKILENKKIIEFYDGS